MCSLYCPAAGALTHMWPVVLVERGLKGKFRLFDVELFVNLVTVSVSAAVDGNKHAVWRRTKDHQHGR